MILKIFKCTVVGYLVGLGFVLHLVFCVQLPHWLMGFSYKINAPAYWLAHTWSHDFLLPPNGEAGVWLIVPSAMMLLQWGLIGLLVGMIWTSSKEKFSTAPQPATDDKAKRGEEEK